MSENARQSLHAVFEGGVFRPLSTPSLGEGTRVHLLVEPEPEVQQGAASPIELLVRVYDGLSDAEIADLESIILARGAFFGRAPSR